MIAVSCAQAREIDEAAISGYGIPEAELVRAAGAGCAAALSRFPQRPISILAGAGNNAADALCAGGRLVSQGIWELSDLTVVLRSPKELEALDRLSPGETPFAEHLRALAAAGARIVVWDGESGEAARALRASRLLVDGLAGTGLSGAPRGAAAELISFLNSLASDGEGRLVAAIDLPSGLSDGTRDRSSVVRADITLAVEPVKACLYKPFARSLAGGIIPVLGIFPPELLEGSGRIEVVDFAAASRRLPPVAPDSYKHRRGLVEIRAGSVGATGAAKLAARGAAAAGAGLIRLVADEETWPILAASETGAMVKKDTPDGFSPPADACLVGPGWGGGASRKETLRALLAAAGTALVLDADAIRLVSGEGWEERLPDGSIATPHPGEFALFSGTPKDELDFDPDPVLLETAARRNAVVILKGHVMRVAAPDGRIAYVDGMEPVLAVGGSGDVLAGLAAGLAARARRGAAEAGAAYDPFPVAVAAAALLVEAGRAARRERGFCDAAEFAAAAGKIAGDAWLRTYPT